MHTNFVLLLKKQTFRELSLQLLSHSSNAHDDQICPGCGRRLYTVCKSPTHVSGPQLLEPTLLSARVWITRKLESGTRARYQPNEGCSYLPTPIHLLIPLFYIVCRGAGDREMTNQEEGEDWERKKKEKERVKGKGKKRKREGCRKKELNTYMDLFYVLREKWWKNIPFLDYKLAKQLIQNIKLLNSFQILEGQYLCFAYPHVPWL